MPYRPAVKKLLERFPELQEAARLLLEKHAAKPELRTLRLPEGDLLHYQDLFLNCAKCKNGRLQLELAELRTCLGERFEEWLAFLAETIGWQPQCPGTAAPLLPRLLFEYPEIDWEHCEQIRNATEDDWEDIRDARKTARRLLGQMDFIAYADLAGQLFQDTKYFRSRPSVLTWTVRLLKLICPLEESLSDKALLRHFGLDTNPTASTVTVFGPFTYALQGKNMDWPRTLWEQGQSAILSAENLSGVSRLETGGLPLLSIENESAFHRMMRSAGSHALVYTAGFPGRAVRMLLQALPADIPLYHWGDSDPEGYEIAAALHAIHPLRLFRTNVQCLEEQRANMRPLTEKKRHRAQRLARDSAFPFPEEIRWLLSNNLWLEQELYREGCATPDSLCSQSFRSSGG